MDGLGNLDLEDWRWMPIYMVSLFSHSYRGLLLYDFSEIELFLTKKIRGGCATKRNADRKAGTAIVEDIQIGQQLPNYLLCPFWLTHPLSYE